MTEDYKVQNGRIGASSQYSCQPAIKTFFPVLRVPVWAGQWWHTPLIPAFRRQRQADLCEFKASLVYKVSSSRTARAVTQRKSAPPPERKMEREREKEKEKEREIYNTSWREIYNTFF